MPDPLTPPDPPLHGDGFRLRPFTARDAPAVHAAGNDPRITGHTFMPANPSDEVVARWLQRSIDSWRHGAARLAVVAADDPGDRCIGQVALGLAAYPPGNAEIAYWLLAEARGRGWAPQALRLVCDWAFATAPVERIAALVDLDNVASQRTATRAGFTREGVLRGYEEAPRRGRVDLWSFSLLRADLG